MSVRGARLTDSRDLWSWRNDPLTRAMSESSSEVSWDDHQDWTRRVLSDPLRIVLICEVGHSPCGMVRFDLADGTATVSINVEPGSRGKGLGNEMLSAAIHWLTREHGSLLLRAKIRTDNLASQALFRKAGFELESSEGDFLVVSRSASSPDSSAPH